MNEARLTVVDGDQEYDPKIPCDVDAEQSTLGAMMQSAEAATDVLEIIRSPEDFYRPKHSTIFRAILACYDDQVVHRPGGQVEARVVHDKLLEWNDLAKVGGANYLHDLIAMAPTAANAGYYAEKVRDKAVLRRAREAGQRLVAMTETDSADPKEVIERVTNQLATVDNDDSHDIYAAGDLANDTLAELEVIQANGGPAQGVLTGFTDLDALTLGLHPGQMVIVAARPGVGKALALDTVLPTSDGWTTMGEVAVGDHLIGSDGNPTKVVAATEVMHDRPCFEVEFSDGTTVVADAHHQWALNEGEVVTTEQLVAIVPAPVAHRADLKFSAVRPVESVPVRCVEVDAEDHLYLCTCARIPTHNSTLGLDFARAASIRQGLPSVIFSLEMGRSEIMQKIFAAEARVRLGDMRAGKMTDDDWTRLARRMSEINDAPLFVDDSPNLTMMDIRAKARRLKQRDNIQLIVVDYMQLMTSGKRVESRQQEVSEFSRNLKLLAKELEVPLVAISQLNRGPEQRTDKKPQLSDLRESGSIEQDCDLAILIHRPDAFERDDPRMGEADLMVAKHRAGPTATITVAHQLHYSRFVDMAQE